jgi:creatinine amidohydrolase
MTECRYEYLYGEELFDLIQKCPLAWVPMGILEKHGGHLPWGLDGLKAHAICLELAQKIGGVVLPASHLSGIHGDRKDETEETFLRRRAKAGDFLYAEALFRHFLEQTFHSLVNIGFEVIVAYTGHYPNIQTQILRDVAEGFTKLGRANVIPFWEPLACGEGDHAGKWETAIYLALKPDEVRLEDVCDEATGRAGFYRGKDVGNQASKALGQKALAQVEAYLSAAVGKALHSQGKP